MPYGVDPADVTMMAQTMWGENTQASPDEYTAIANVMRNRLLSGDPSYGGNTMPQILRAKNQFQAWNSPSAPNYPTKAPTDSPAFQSAYKAASDVMSGLDEDPTNGALYYYNPKGVNKTPSFAVGKQGQPIGQHVFYGGKPDLPPEDQAVINKYYPQENPPSVAGLKPEDQAVIDKYYPSDKTPDVSESKSRVAGAFGEMQQAEDARLAAIDKPLREVGPSSEELAKYAAYLSGARGLVAAPGMLRSIITQGIPAASKALLTGGAGGLMAALATETLGPEKGAKVMDILRHIVHYAPQE